MINPLPEEIQNTAKPDYPAFIARMNELTAAISRLKQERQEINARYVADLASWKATQPSTYETKLEAWEAMRTHLSNLWDDAQRVMDTAVADYKAWQLRTGASPHAQPHDITDPDGFSQSAQTAYLRDIAQARKALERAKAAFNKHEAKEPQERKPT